MNEPPIPREPGRVLSLAVPAAKAVLVALLGGYSWFYLTASLLQLGDHSSFAHRVHLVFHEAGHVLLMWAPQVWVALGGTLGQLVVPLVLVAAFVARNRDGYAASLCTWWFGHSLVDVAPYINDARTMRLMLLGGGTGTEIEGHDWNFILEHWNALDVDIYLARGVLLAGRVVMAMGLLAAAGFALAPLWKRRRPAAE